MSDWKPGMRHQVREATGYDDAWGVLHWRCVDCGQWFTRWPSDDVECPGPKDKRTSNLNNRLHSPADRPGVPQQAPDPQRPAEGPPVSDYTIISNEGSDTICGDCHQQLAEWTVVANAAIRKALGTEGAD